MYENIKSLIPSIKRNTQQCEKMHSLYSEMQDSLKFSIRLEKWLSS